MSKIKFCVTCGKILHLHIDGNKILCKCECGYTEELDSEISFSSKILKEERGDGVGVEDESIKGFPHKCRKCGHEGCDIIDLGASWADESNIYLYKCKKCKFVERQAEGSSNM